MIRCDIDYHITILIKECGLNTFKSYIVSVSKGPTFITKEWTHYAYRI